MSIGHLVATAAALTALVSTGAALTACEETTTTTVAADPVAARISVDAWAMQDLICNELYAYGIYSMYAFNQVDTVYWANFSVAFESTSQGVPWVDGYKQQVLPVIRSCFR